MFTKHSEEAREINYSTSGFNTPAGFFRLVHIPDMKIKNPFLVIQKILKRILSQSDRMCNIMTESHARVKIPDLLPYINGSRVEFKIRSVIMDGQANVIFPDLLFHIWKKVDIRYSHKSVCPDPLCIGKSLINGFFAFHVDGTHSVGFNSERFHLFQCPVDHFL